MSYLTGIIEFLTGRRLFPAIESYCPDGLRVYCVGDIHGRADLLKRLHAQIASDACDYSGRKIVVYLGDYIDRGEQSKEVLDLLLSEPLAGFAAVFLRGNHEQTVLDFLQQHQVGIGWLTFGGMATLASYGVRISKLPARDEDYKKLQAELARSMPPDHLFFLQKTGLSYTLGSYYFVHAGVKPGIALQHQQPYDQLWIRDEFLASRDFHEKIIIHGHSITEMPELLPNRINIDTGAYASGRLTALILENSTQRLLQT